MRQGAREARAIGATHTTQLFEVKRVSTHNLNTTEKSSS